MLKPKLIDTVHICSTLHDVDYMNQSFKNILNNIFSKKAPDVNHMCIDQPLLPASVTVKGPLNVQQYYDLSGKKKKKRKKDALCFLYMLL